VQYDVSQEAQVGGRKPRRCVLLLMHCSASGLESLKMSKGSKPASSGYGLLGVSNTAVRSGLFLEVSLCFNCMWVHVCIPAYICCMAVYTLQETTQVVQHWHCQQLICMLPLLLLLLHLPTAG
jgi:hypothetical protein